MTPFENAIEEGKGYFRILMDLADDTRLPLEMRESILTRAKGVIEESKRRAGIS